MTRAGSRFRHRDQNLSIELDSSTQQTGREIVHVRGGPESEELFRAKVSIPDKLSGRTSGVGTKAEE